MQKILSIVFYLFSTISAYPVGKYCANVGGATLNVTFTQNNISNISANIFGEKIECDEAMYLVNGSHLEYNKNPKSCLNEHLSGMNACPCPPRVLYDSKDNNIIVEDTLIGNITLKPC